MNKRPSSSLLHGALFLSAASLLAFAAPPEAQAGAVFRCNGPNGQVAFTNKPASFTGCKKVTDYVDMPAPKSSAASKHTEYHSDPAATTAATAATAAPEPASAQPAGATDKAVDVHRGAVYKVARSNGITEYTNVRPAHGGYKMLFTYISTCFACNVRSTVNWMATALNLTAYKQEVAAAATEFGLDPALLRAVIHAESAFNPNAISNAGAEGLMQLMPGTASDLGVANPFDVGQNIRGGAQYLAGLLKQFNGNERLATAAYNAGPQNVTKYNNTVPPFDETRVYVDRVATLRQRYHGAE